MTTCDCSLHVRNTLQPCDGSADRSTTSAGHGRPDHDDGGGDARLPAGPIVRDRKGEYKKEFLELRKQGFQRVKVDGEFYELDEPPTLDKKFRHDIDVVVDRLVVREGMETRLADSLRTALDLADGIAILETAPREGDPERITFSENFACPVSGFTIPEIEPRLFSFNAPFGACPDCDGLGVELFFDERLVVPDQTLKLYDGPWRRGERGNLRISCKPSKPSRAIMSSTRARRGKTCPKRCNRCFYEALGMRKSSSAMMKADVSIR